MKTGRKNLFKKQVLPLGLLASAIILFAGCGATDNSGSSSGGGDSIVTNPSGSAYSGPFTCFNGRQDVTPNGLTRCTTSIAPNNSVIQSLGNNGAYPSASSFPGVFAANTISATGTGSASTNQPLTLPITVMSGDWISFQAMPTSDFQQLQSQGQSCFGNSHTIYDLSGSGLASSGYQTVIAQPDTNPNGLTSILSQPSAGCIFSLSACKSDALSIENLCLTAAAGSVAGITACQAAYTSAVAACNTTSTSSRNLTQTLSCLTPVPDGFLASIGPQIYALGTSFNSSVNIAAGPGASMGTLYAGLNKTPWSNFCANIQIAYFKHQHCVDSSGNAAVCPDPRTSGDTSLLF